MWRAASAERDASCVGKAEEERRSTAAPTTRIANVHTRPVPTAAKDCRCARARRCGASNADRRRRPVHRAMACCANVAARTEPFLAARTTLPADTLGKSGSAGRCRRDPTHMARAATGGDTGEEGDDELSSSRRTSGWYSPGRCQKNAAGIAPIGTGSGNNATANGRCRFHSPSSHTAVRDTGPNLPRPAHSSPLSSEGWDAGPL